MGVYWAQDVSYLMGLTEYSGADRVQRMLERVLESISVGSRHTPA